MPQPTITRAPDKASIRDLLFTGLSNSGGRVLRAPMAPTGVYTIHNLLYSLILAFQNAGGGLPDQTGHAGQFLTTDGTTASWAAIPATTPGAPANSLQFNNGGTFGGVTGWTTNGSTSLTGGAGTTFAVGNATIGSNTLAVTGTSLFTGNITQASGNITLPVGSETTPSITFGDANSGIYNGGVANGIGFVNDGTLTARIYNGAFEMPTGKVLRLIGTTTLDWDFDTSLSRNAAGVVASNGAFRTAAPSGGTAANWRFGVAASVSPTSPNRTIEVQVGATTLYIAAKTTND